MRSSPKAKAEAGKPCPILGCPGTLDAKGECERCERRHAFALENADTQTCNVCEGEFPTPLDSPDFYAETCAACRPIAARMANKDSEDEDDEE